MDIVKVERALSPYKFLSWLDTFTYTRESKTNLNLSTQDDDYDGKEDDDANENSVFDNGVEDERGDSDAVIGDDTLMEDEVDEPSNNDNDCHKNSVPVKQKQPNKKNRKRKECDKASEIDQEEISLIKSLKEDLQNQKKSNEESSPVDFFVSSLGADLKTLNERDFILAKHEIQNIVFKYQMARFGQEVLPNNLSNRSTYYNFP